MKRLYRPSALHALHPLSDIAADHPEMRQALVLLGLALLNERIRLDCSRDLVRYHICRIERLSRDRLIEGRVLHAVRRFRAETLDGSAGYSRVLPNEKAPVAFTRPGLRVVK